MTINPAYAIQNEHKASLKILGPKFYLWMVYKFWGFHNCRVEAVHLGYNNGSLGNQFLAFWTTECLYLQGSTVPRRMPDMISRGKYIGKVSPEVLLNSVTYREHNNMSVLRLWCSGINDSSAMAHTLHWNNELQHRLYLLLVRSAFFLNA
jgi:hypothetical protein